MINKTQFQITYQGKSYDLKLHQQSFKLQISDRQSQRATIEIVAISEKQLVSYQDPDIGNTDYIDSIALFIEHLQIPLSDIKQKDFRSLQAIIIDYEQNWALTPHPMLTPTSDIIGVITTQQIHPSGDYITSLKAGFTHLSNGLFQISLTGKTDDINNEAVSDFSLIFQADLEIEVWDAQSRRDLRELFTSYFHEQDFEISILLSDEGVQQILTVTVKETALHEH